LQEPLLALRGWFERFDIHRAEVGNNQDDLQLGEVDYGLKGCALEKIVFATPDLIDLTNHDIGRLASA